MIRWLRSLACALAGHDWTPTVLAKDVPMDDLGPSRFAVDMAQRLDATVKACKRCDLARWEAPLETARRVGAPVEP